MATVGTIASAPVTGLLGRLAEAIERFIDAVAASRAASLALVAAVAILCFLPGLTTLPPSDRDEPRFAQATKQMVETGDYFDIRFQDEPRYKKPIGIYWLQAAVVQLSGQGADAPIWIYRLPSFLSAVAGACLVWWLALAFGRPRAALLAGLLMASCVLLAVEARLAKTDATLFFVTTAALGVLARAWLLREAKLSRGRALVFWFAIGAGILIKGPITLGVVGVAAIFLSIEQGSFRWLGRLSPHWGIPLAILIALPWFVAITLTSGLAFFEESLGRDMFQKVASGVESHGAPPGTYTLIGLATFWPASIALIPAIRPIFRRLGDPAIRFGLLSGLPLFLLFEAFPTKLPHYVLPLYPLAALMVGTVLDVGEARVRGWFTRLASFGGVTMTGALIIAAILAAQHFKEPPPFLTVAVLVAALLLGLVAGLLYARSPIAGIVTAVATAVVTYFAVFGLFLSDVTAFRLSGRLAEAGKAALTCPDPQFASAGFSEPSLVFLAGTKTLLGGGDDAADFLAQGGCRLAFVDRRELEAFNSRIDDLGLEVTQRGYIEGYNISKDRNQRMQLFTLAGEAR